MPRVTPLQNFVDALRESFLVSNAGGDARSFAERIVAAADVTATAVSLSPARLPVCRHLATALETARVQGGPVARLAGALAALESELRWDRRPPVEHEEDGFRDGHANAVVLGAGGLEARNDIQVGVSLLAPATRYPDHCHPPEEIYCVLSPGAWRQAQGAWHEPGIGGVVHNPPSIVHAMRAGSAPLLAVWCLWTAAGTE